MPGKLKGGENKVTYFKVTYFKSFSQQIKVVKQVCHGFREQIWVNKEKVAGKPPPNSKKKKKSND